MKRLIMVLVLLLMTFPLYSDIRNDIKSAVDSYKAGNYSQTIKTYETIISDGFCNPVIYYNLANSYLNVNDIGKASLNNERALILTPRDKDIRNLKSYISELIKEPEQNFAEKVIENLKLILNLNEITFLILFLFCIFGIFVILYLILYRKIWLKVAIVCFICFVLCLPVFYLKIKDEVFSKQAVIIKNVDVRNKPIFSEAVSFSIDAGRKVIVLEEIGRWANVKLSVEGLSGWIDKHSVEII